MKKMWAPWRVEYIRAKKASGCIFCQKSQENKDSLNYIVLRGKENFVILNSYPYNPGHLMVAPYRHVPSLEELSDAELLEHFDLVRRSTRSLREAFGALGFNIGINMGDTAGAGVADHIHTHVVPRWKGDTNFMPVVFDVKVVSEGLDATYAQLIDKMK